MFPSGTHAYFQADAHFQAHTQEHTHNSDAPVLFQQNLMAYSQDPVKIYLLKFSTCQNRMNDLFSVILFTHSFFYYCFSYFML